MTDKLERPFLKWAGGKRQHIPWICQHLPKADQLVEPFVGAGAVFLNTEYDHYWLNDINPDLILLYRMIKRKKRRFIADASRLFVPSNNQAMRYYTLRERFNETDDDEERAGLFLYLNRHGYNGLCRYNSQGGFNVPFGRYKKPYFPQIELLHFIKKASRTTLTCLPYEKVFKRVSNRAVVYCDPPYVPLSRTANFTAYSQTPFTLKDQTKLATLAERAAACGVPVLINNHDLPYTRQLYQRACISSMQAKRVISRDAMSRQKVAELLAVFNRRPHGCDATAKP